jgi:hypothetical protein
VHNHGAEEGKLAPDLAESAAKNGAHKYQNVKDHAHHFLFTCVICWLFSSEVTWGKSHRCPFTRQNLAQNLSESKNSSITQEL